MKKNNKKGFTLVELVIVVAVMAVLVAVAIPTVQSITKTAKNTVADTNARTIESTIKLAEAEASKKGDGIATLDATAIDKALTNAKLGIAEGSFIYDATTGTVTVGDDAAVNQFQITFDADAEEEDDVIDVVKVTAQSGNQGGSDQGGSDQGGSDQGGSDQGGDEEGDGE